MHQLLAIFIGGGLGSLLRYAIGKLSHMAWPGLSLPLGTLIANVISCIIFGLVLFLFPMKFQGDTWQRGLILIGFCGGLSTFSTFSFETFQMIRNQQLSWALMNAVISVFLCVLILWLFLKK